MGDDVRITVDPHKASNTAVMDPDTKIVIASQRFANTTAGYRQLRDFGARWEQRRWAVKRCHGAGRSLAQRLVVDGEVVLDVPAKLAARVRVYSQGHARKTDVDDAVSIGLAALNSSGVAAVRVVGVLVSLRLLSDRRDELGALRTQAVCRFHLLLAELTPGGTHRGLRANRAQQLLDKLRPDDPVAQVRLQLAERHLEDIRALDAKMKTVRSQIEELLHSTGSHLVDLYGVGPVIAGRILAEVETIDRFPSKDHFASYNGTAPIDASSGDHVRHRLSRAGNRRINHALHMMAVTQIRYPASTGRIYYERNGSRERHRQRPCASSNDDSPTSSTANSWLSGQAESKRAHHLRPRSRRGPHLVTDEALMPGRTSIPADPPHRIQAFVVLDWKDDRLVGIEVLHASSRLPRDFIEQAEQIG